MEFLLWIIPWNFILSLIFFWFNPVIFWVINNFSLIISHNSMMIQKQAKPLKIVVFDLDETLGCFIEVAMFWDALEHYHGHNLLDEQFYQVMDLFPDFLRPNIFKILAYLKVKKEQQICNKIMIYTNNQGPKSWVQMISKYFNAKLAYPLFDNIIAAFKVRGKIVEIDRTSHDKSVEDLVRCTRIPANTDICFIDDQYHPLMEADNVYYINAKPYTYSLPFKEMAETYYDYAHKSAVLMVIKPDDSKDIFSQEMVKYMQLFHYTVFEKPHLEMEVDKIISKKIMIHLAEFFKNGLKNNTLKKSMIQKKKNIKTHKLKYPK